MAGQLVGFFLFIVNELGMVGVVYDKNTNPKESTMRHNSKSKPYRDKNGWPMTLTEKILDVLFS